MPKVKILFIIFLLCRLALGGDANFIELSFNEQNILVIKENKALDFLKTIASTMSNNSANFLYANFEDGDRQSFEILDVSLNWSEISKLDPILEGLVQNLWLVVFLDTLDETMTIYIFHYNQTIPLTLTCKLLDQSV